MKKTLIFTHDRGFILPLTLLTAALLFLFVGTNIVVYKNELLITKNELSQIKVDTLYQMGHAKFTDVLPELEQDNGTMIYEFPDGEVNIVYQLETSTGYKVTYSIKTFDQKLLVIDDFVSRANPNE